jgi:hypothetical protein
MINQISDSRFQIAEIWQVPGSRLARRDAVCQMLPAQFLLPASCFLLNEVTGRSA